MSIIIATNLGINVQSIIEVMSSSGRFKYIETSNLINNDLSISKNPNHFCFNFENHLLYHKLIKSKIIAIQFKYEECKYKSLNQYYRRCARLAQIGKMKNGLLIQSEVFYTKEGFEKIKDFLGIN